MESNLYAPRFFDTDNRYEFLVFLEENYADCSSICDTSLFSLTRDVRLGMPRQECLMVAFNEAIATANAAAGLLGLGCYLALISAPMAYCVCEPYDMADIAVDKEDDEEKLAGDDKDPVKMNQDAMRAVMNGGNLLGKIDNLRLEIPDKSEDVGFGDDKDSEKVPTSRRDGQPLKGYD